LKAIGATEFHFTAHQFVLPSEGFQHPNFPSSEYQKKLFDVQKLQASLK
ncbi:MAG: hypothetical protein JKY03_13635, partial [Aureispira sp.]|nr:hypothetical protein [Aureispira sp.]